MQSQSIGNYNPLLNYTNSDNNLKSIKYKFNIINTGMNKEVYTIHQPMLNGKTTLSKNLVHLPEICLERNIWFINSVSTLG